jgi:hypothetical protein
MLLMNIDGIATGCQASRGAVLLWALGNTAMSNTDGVQSWPLLSVHCSKSYHVFPSS